MNKYVIVSVSSVLGKALVDLLSVECHNIYSAYDKTEVNCSEQKMQYLHLNVTKANADRYSLQKIDSPQDIANTTAFILSDQSSSVTRQILTVDRGLSSIKI